MTVVWASRKVAGPGEYQLRLRFDAGEWTIEAESVKTGADGGKLKVSTAAMDQLVEEWPKFRESVLERAKGAENGNKG